MHLYVSQKPLPMDELLQDYLRMTGSDQLLRSALEDTDALEIKRDSNGKPFFPQIPEIHFSISHSGWFWACVFHEKEIGLDIEDPTIRRKAIPIDRLAKRYFSPEEQEFCEGRDLKTFLQIWTRKEAYLKCVGTGISGGLSGFSVVAGDTLKESVNEKELYDLANLSGFSDTGLIGALCVAHKLVEGELTWSQR
jgi:phosphopantetheinyl transferase